MEQIKYPLHVANTTEFGDHIQDSDGNHAPLSAGFMRRIVACVNSCAGIPTEDLERYGAIATQYEFSLIEILNRITKQRDDAEMKRDGYRQQLASVERQRDVLLTALKLARSYVVAVGVTIETPDLGTINDAIAKAGGGE